jgi:hypothetical protein
MFLKRALVGVLGAKLGDLILPPGALYAPGEVPSGLGLGVRETGLGVSVRLAGRPCCPPGRGLEGFFLSCQLPRSLSEVLSELDRCGGKPGDTDPLEREPSDETLG